MKKILEVIGCALAILVCTITAVGWWGMLFDCVRHDDCIDDFEIGLDED